MYEAEMFPKEQWSGKGGQNFNHRTIICLQWYFVIYKVEKETLSVSQCPLAAGFLEGSKENILHIFQALLQNRVFRLGVDKWHSTFDNSGIDFVTNFRFLSFDIV